MTDNPVKRYRRKPEKPRSTPELVVAKYVPGQPLTALAGVAQLSYAELAEVSLPSGPVLLVKCLNTIADRPFTDWIVVEPGEYLAFSGRSGGLSSTDDDDLKYWYEPVDDTDPKRAAP